MPQEGCPFQSEVMIPHASLTLCTALSRDSVWTPWVPSGSVAGQRGVRADREFQGQWLGPGGWNGWDNSEMRWPNAPENKTNKNNRKIRLGDSHRTPNIHLMDQIWAYMGKGGGSRLT